MKHKILTLLILALATSVSFISCNNNKGRGNSTTANMGALPTINCLISPNNSQGFCNYPYGNYPGFANYDHTLMINGLNNNYATGFCGCGQSGYPVYNNNWGLGCLNNTSLPQGYGYYNTIRLLMFTWNPQAIQWTTYQPNNYYNYGYGAATCSTMSVIIACDTGVQGACGPTASCLSLNGLGSGGNGGYSQSGPGVCVVNQNNGYYRY